MQSKIERSCLAVLVVAAGIQVLPPAITPERRGAQTPRFEDRLNPQVGAIIRRACKDCHSNETRWPWYSHVAPVSWIVARDVKRGREKLNFSDWSLRTHSANELQEICDAVTNGSMPLRGYRLVHREAALSMDDVDVICEWADTATEQIRPSPQQRNHDRPQTRDSATDDQQVVTATVTGSPTPAAQPSRETITLRTVSGSPAEAVSLDPAGGTITLRTKHGVSSYLPDRNAASVLNQVGSDGKLILSWRFNKPGQPEAILRPVPLTPRSPSTSPPARRRQGSSQGGRGDRHECRREDAGRPGGRGEEYTMTVDKRTTRGDRRPPAGRPDRPGSGLGPRDLHLPALTAGPWQPQRLRPWSDGGALREPRKNPRGGRE